MRIVAEQHSSEFDSLEKCPIQVPIEDNIQILDGLFGKSSKLLLVLNWQFSRPICGGSLIDGTPFRLPRCDIPRRYSPAKKSIAIGSVILAFAVSSFAAAPSGVKHHALAKVGLAVTFLVRHLRIGRLFRNHWAQHRNLQLCLQLDGDIQGLDECEIDSGFAVPIATPLSCSGCGLRRTRCLRSRLSAL